MKLKSFHHFTWMLLLMPALAIAQAGMTPDKAAIGGAGAPSGAANYYRTNFLTVRLILISPSTDSRRKM